MDGRRVKMLFVHSFPFALWNHDCCALNHIHPHKDYIIRLGSIYYYSMSPRVFLFCPVERYPQSVVGRRT